MNKDFLGNELAAGDWVLFVELEYRSFMFGKIAKVTEKTVLIRHVYKHSKSSYKETRQFHEQVIKVPIEQVKKEFLFDESTLSLI